MSPNYADETLDAVALILRDIKSEFDHRLKTLDQAHTEHKQKVIQYVSNLQRGLDTAAARTDNVLENAKNVTEESKQDAQNFIARLKEEWNANSAEQRTQTEKLKKDFETNRKTVESVTAEIKRRQETVLESLRSLKKSEESVKANLDGIEKEFESSRIEEKQFRAAVVDREAERIQILGKQSAQLTQLQSEISSVDTQFKEHKTFHEECFLKIDTDHEALVKAQERYRQEISARLEDSVNRTDLESTETALKEELIEENARRIAQLRGTLEAGIQEASVKNRQFMEQTRTSFDENLQKIQTEVSSLQERIEEAGGQLEDRLSALVETRGKLSEQLLVDQTERFIEKLSANIRGERGPCGFLSRVQRWVEDYQFPELTLVVHRSGLWQAVRDTTQEPSVDLDGDWMPVSAGIDEVTVTQIDEAELGSYELKARDTFGREHTGAITVPIPKFYKTWESGRRYRFYDSTVEDGHRWLAVKDDPRGPPSRSEDWVLFGMRGARGPRGARGEPGPAGALPNMDDVLDAYERRTDQKQGTPISSYRGGWRYGTDYFVGDMVQGDNGSLALCCENHRAEKPPNTVDRSQWQVFVKTGAEGASGHEELQARIQRQEHLISKLAEKMEKLTTGAS